MISSSDRTAFWTGEVWAEDDWDSARLERNRGMTALKGTSSTPKCKDRLNYSAHKNTSLLGVRPSEGDEDHFSHPSVVGAERPVCGCAGGLQGQSMFGRFSVFSGSMGRGLAGTSGRESLALASYFFWPAFVALLCLSCWPRTSCSVCVSV